MQEGEFFFKSTSPLLKGSNRFRLHQIEIIVLHTPVLLMNTEYVVIAYLSLFRLNKALCRCSVDCPQSNDQVIRIKFRDS